MARKFNGATNNLKVALAAVDVPTITMMAHVKPGTSSTNLRVVSITDISNANRRICLGVDFNTNRTRINSNDGSTNAVADSVTTVTIGQWNHIAGIELGTSRLAYTNAETVGSDATSLSFTAGLLDTTTIGARENSGGVVESFIGDIADIGIWNVQLTLDEITAHKNGTPAYLIRPENLVGYWPLNGIQSPEPDLSGNAYNLTVSGATKSNHAPVSLFTRKYGILDVITAGGGTTVSPGKGNIEYIGFAPSLLIERIISAGKGLTEYIGSRPAVSFAKVISPGQAIELYQGLAPTVTAVDGLTAIVSPGTGQIEYIGTQPTLKIARTILAGKGQEEYIGYQPTIEGTQRIITINAGQGRVIFIGSAPDVISTVAKWVSIEKESGNWTDISAAKTPTWTDL